MRIKKLDNFREFQLIRKEWNSLLDRSRNNCVSMTHEWLCTWWEAFGDDACMWVLLLWNGNRLSAAAPLALRRDRFRGLPAQKLSLMANGHSPEANILVEKSDQNLMNHFLEYLLEHSSEWDVLKLEKLPVQSSTAGQFEKRLADAGFSSIRVDSLSSPYIDMAGDWDSYYAGRSKKFRKVMRNKLNRVQRNGSTSIERISDPETIRSLLSEIFTVSAKSWKAEYGRSILDDPRVETFYKRITDVMGEKGIVELWLMRHDNRAIAFEYHLRDGGITYPIRADFDKAYSHLSPGSLLEYEIIKALFDDDRIQGYNSCGDTYEYLMKWATEIRERVGFLVFGPKTYSKNLFLLESKMIPAARKARDLLKLRKAGVKK